MVRTESQSNISFSESVFIGDEAVMSLTANIEISKPNELSYSPVVMNANKYMENREEIKKIQSNFEDKVVQKQQELISGTY